MLLQSCMHIKSEPCEVLLGQVAYQWLPGPAVATPTAAAVQPARSQGPLTTRPPSMPHHANLLMARA